MYEERRDKFSIKDILIQVLFVAVFIFLLMWLFPMKKDVKNALKNLNIETQNLQPLYDQIFNNNVQTMKEAAISYYTTPRLPEKIGDEKKMTLSDMLKNNLILSFTDSKGKQCDLLESYVSITKMSDEYILKVNLKCSEQEDYILVHLGCYNYCDGGICEKKEETPVVNPTPDPTPKPTPVVNDKYEYEYIKVTDGKWGDWSNWSDWTKNVITSTDYRAVETKKVKETETKTIVETKEEPVYGTKTIQTGVNKVSYKETVPVIKYKTVPVYEEKQVKVGYEPIFETKTEIVKEPIYETKKVTKYREETYIIKYEIDLDCENACKKVSKPVYGTKKVPYEDTVTEITGYKEKKVEKQVPVGTKPKYETKKVQVGTKQESYTENVEVTKYKEEPVYTTITVQTGVKKVDVEKQVTVDVWVTYYRSKTREFISGTTDTKWSTSQNDQSLLSNGYTLTGNSRKI